MLYCGSDQVVADWNALLHGEIGADDAVALQHMTVIHATSDAAKQALADLMDAYGRSDRQVGGGETTDGFGSVDVPAAVGLGVRAVGAIMDNGSSWPHGCGCVTNGHVMQCVAVWSRSEERSQTWLDTALTATADRIRRVPTDSGSLSSVT